MFVYVQVVYNEILPLNDTIVDHYIFHTISSQNIQFYKQLLTNMSHCSGAKFTVM